MRTKPELKHFPLLRSAFPLGESNFLDRGIIYNLGAN